MRLSILDLKNEIWQGAVKQVLLPTADGQMCVLDFHQSFVVRLEKGEIIFSGKRLPIRDGIAFMHSNALDIFAQT